VPPAKPAEQIKALLKHANDALADFRKKYEAAKSDDDLEKLIEQIPDRDGYPSKEPAAFNALIWAP
jgi:hypothetical protein